MCCGNYTQGNVIIGKWAFAKTNCTGHDEIEFHQIRLAAKK